MKQTRLLVNNPVEVTEADALELYRQAFWWTLFRELHWNDLI